MKLQIQSVHFTADKNLLDFIQKKLDKLDTFFDRIIGGEVILRVERPETHDNKMVDVKIYVPGATLFCKEHADSFEAAIDKAEADMKKQLIRYKEKVLSHH